MRFTSYFEENFLQNEKLTLTNVLCNEKERSFKVSLKGEELLVFPKETIMGSMANYISIKNENFQPMNVNFSIIAPLEQKIRKKAEKNLAIANRSLEIIDELAKAGI